MDFKVYTRGSENDIKPMFVYIRPYEFRVAKPAAAKMGIGKDSFIAFVEIGNEWFVCKYDHDDKGYHVALDNTRSGFVANCAHMNRVMLRTLVPGRNRMDGMLEPTGYSYFGYPLFKIIKRNINN